MRDPNEERLIRELEAFEPEAAIETARTPPASWYRSGALLDLEARTVFRGSFLAVARADQLAAPGSYVAGRLLDERYVVLRDLEGRLGALHNVCRHHGAEIAAGCGRARALVCPYHAWSYELSGRLRAAPRAPHVERLAERPALPPIRAAAWGPLALIDLGGEAPPPEELFAAFARRHPPESLLALRFVRRRVWRLRCNWKVFVENYLDGGYHVPHAHRALAGQLELASYRSEVGPRGSLQLCDAGGSERLGAAATYAFVHPNLMLNRYGPVLDVNVVVPTGPERCEVVFDHWFEPELADSDPAFVERSLAASDEVQREDALLCESVQRGLADSSYGRGWYVPGVEEPMLAFHRQLARELRAGR